MTTYTQRCLIVPADYTPLARALCDGLASGGSGAGMLATPANSTGAGQATHYISAGMIEDTFAHLLPLTVFDAEGTPTTTPGQPDAIYARAQQAGSSVTLAQVKALLDAVDVTEQAPFVALARKGLMLIQGTL